MIVKPRICQECGHRYVVPLPRWIGVITYLAAATVVGSMTVDWLAPPADWSIHFTWKGRIGVLAAGGFLVWMGTMVLRGKTGCEWKSDISRPMRPQSQKRFLTPFLD